MKESAPLPLVGVRVLAIEQMQAMPFATQLMAHLGAEVVKVEHPEHGESGRSAAPSIEDADGRRAGATFLRNNLCKKSVGIDLKKPEGVELVKRLVPHYDVLAENFKPGTMERLGLDYDVLEELHPGLIYVAVSGFGSLLDTPYGHWPAYAVLPEAMGGSARSLASSMLETSVGHQRVALTALLAAIERFSQIRELIELAYRDQTLIVSLLTPPEVEA